MPSAFFAVHPTSCLTVPCVTWQVRTRVLVMSDYELDLSAESLHLAPSLIKLDARLDALSLTIVDEAGNGGRPQELLHAAMRTVRLVVAPPSVHVARRATEAQFSIGLLQVDNLLPATSHPVVLQTPRKREATARGTGGGGGAGGGGAAGAAAGGAAASSARRGSAGGGGGSVPDSKALRIVVRRRASGQLQDVAIELQPTDVALEASFLTRLGRLLVASADPSTGTSTSSSRVAERLQRTGRIGHVALDERLGSALAVPPDWSSRVPFYCDKLHIAEMDLRVSSRLDTDVSGELLLFGSDAADGRSHEGGGEGRAALSELLSVPVLSHLVSTLLQLMMVLLKGIGANLANISGVPVNFEPLTEKHPLCTKTELVYKLGQRLSWQAAAQLGKLIGHSEMLGNPMGMITQVRSN